MSRTKNIYVYKLWDFWNGRWVHDTESNRSKIDDSESNYFVDEETYSARLINLTPRFSSGRKE